MNKRSGRNIEDFLKEMRDYFLDDTIHSEEVIEEPLRAELYSSEQMAMHSMSLAR